jgi:oligopeptide transport system substrate-binding protein
MWYRKLLGVTAALALVLAACGPSPVGSPAGTPTAPEGTPGMAADQVLRVPASEPPTLDPSLATDTASILILSQISRPLLWSTPDLDYTFEGGLAEDFTVSDDGLTYTFTLKEGLTYSNGDPIVADDLVYSWKRILDPRLGAGYSYELGPGFGNVAGSGPLLDMAGLEELPADADIEAALDAVGVSAPDDLTFEVETTQVTGFFPFIATLWFTAPFQQSWVESGEDFTEAENYVASGPFIMTTWSHDEEIIVEPNPEWHGDPPLLSRIEFTMTDDPEIDYQAYLNDEVDLAAVPSAHAEEVRGDPDLAAQAITGDVLCTYYLGFDMDPENDESPVENQALRHAIVKAIDRETLIDTVRAGIGRPADSFIPVGMPGHQEGIGPQHFDVDAAQADLETALGELGLSDASELDLTLGFNTGAGHEEIMEFVQAQLQENLGITVTLDGLEWGAYLESLNNNPADLFRLGWCNDYVHPNNFLADVFSCDTGNNRGGYCNEDYDAILLEASAIVDVEEALPMYADAQEMLVEDSPAAFIYWYGRFTLVKPWVQGLIPTAADATTGSTFYDKVWIQEHEM